MPTKPVRATRPGGKQKPAPPKKTKGGAGGHQGRITVPKSAPKKPGATPKAGKNGVLVMGEIYKKKVAQPKKKIGQLPMKPGGTLMRGTIKPKKTTKKRKPE